MQFRTIGSLLAIMSIVAASAGFAAEPFALTLRRQRPAAGGGDAAATYVAHTEAAAWEPAETAVVVCDVWDLHHCRNAVDRLAEFAPRIAAICAVVRERGGTVIHAPSDCMPAYADHPARKRVLDLVAAGVPAGFTPAPDAAFWCSALPAEGEVDYPIDQSLGGEDDAPDRHAAWAAELESLGRNPKMPWKTQSPLVPIDPEADFISDRGEEVARILAHRGVRRVMLVGVHLNMCVLGRPFGLRRMVAAGHDTVLVRDLTDTMYDPAQWPWVDHFTGTDLMIDHVERHVCPTITSDQLLGLAAPFAFSADHRPRTSRRPVVAPADPTARWVSVRDPDTARRLLAAADERLPTWRRVVIVPGRGAAEFGLVVSVAEGGRGARAWLDGTPLSPSDAADGDTTFVVPRDALAEGRPALLVVAVERAAHANGVLAIGPGGPGGGRTTVTRYQVRLGTGPGFESMPLPAQFGGSADIVLDLPD